MRATLVRDDEMIVKAQTVTGVSGQSALIREALRALIQRRSAKRLALLGGSERLLEGTPPRRAKPSS